MSAFTVRKNLVRYILGLLLLVLALNAFAGGYYAMAGAPNVPLSWLRGSPFNTYFIPGLILFLFVGGAALFAAIMVFRQQPIARKAAIACAAILFGWIVVQMLIIGYVSPLQPAIAITSIVILLLATQLPKHGH